MLQNPSRVVEFKLELPQIVRTAQKLLWRIKFNFKQHTDFVFQAESVLYLIGFFRCCIIDPFGILNLLF